MRKVAETGAVDRASVPVRQLIMETAQLLRVECAGVAITVDSPHDVTAWGDAVQIQQVLLNFLRNACETLSDLNTKEVMFTVSELADEVRICVSDNGPGIDPQILPTLFEAGPSTKSSGMGIGLSICRTIIEAHGGRIDAENLPEGGACFCFTLPKEGN